MKLLTIVTHPNISITGRCTTKLIFGFRREEVTPLHLSQDLNLNHLDCRSETRRWLFGNLVSVHWKRGTGNKEVKTFPRKSILKIPGKVDIIRYWHRRSDSDDFKDIINEGTQFFDSREKFPFITDSLQGVIQ